MQRKAKRALQPDTIPYQVRYFDSAQERVVTQDFRYLEAAITSGQELQRRGFDVVLADVFNQQLIELRVEA